MRLVERIRLGYRLFVFVVSTFLFWMCFEIESRLRRKHRLAVINRWVPMWARFNLKVFGVQIETYGKYLDEGRPYPGCELESNQNGTVNDVATNEEVTNDVATDGETASNAAAANEDKPAGPIGRVFVANHRSGMDIPLLFTLAETRVISRHDIADWPLLGSSAASIGTLFVDRTSRRSGAKVLREIDKTLKRGEGVAMFPEGTAHVGDEVQEFQPGAFNAALRAGAEIIPFGIAYSDHVAYFDGQPFLKHMTRIACHRGLRIAIEVGEPLNFDEHSAAEVKDLARERVQELVNRARARLEA